MERDIFSGNSLGETVFCNSAPKNGIKGSLLSDVEQ